MKNLYNKIARYFQVLSWKREYELLAEENGAYWDGYNANKGDKNWYTVNHILWQEWNEGFRDKLAGAKPFWFENDKEYVAWLITELKKDE